MRYLILGITLAAMSLNSFASHDGGASIFVKREYHDDDFLSGVGAEFRLTNPRNNFGTVLSTTIGPASVTDYSGYQQEYIAWEGGVKVGYFSKIFFYVEAGVDIGELAFDDRDEDHYHHRHDYYEENDVDGYVGAGFGINLGRLKLEGFSRHRQVDGEYWDAPRQTFSGVQISVNF